MNSRYAKFIFALLLMTVLAEGQAQISSTFESDDDGWTFSSPHTYNATGGNPGGYISATYSSNTNASAQYWIAPAKFRGNHVVKSIDMSLSFDLQQSESGTASFGSGDVRIESNSVTIVYSLPVKPALAPGWSSHSIKLDETAGWKVNSTTGAVATRSQIIAALSNISAIEIRATYFTRNPYTAGIDNVVLEERTLLPAPSIGAITTLRAAPGTTLTISGSGFGASPQDNEVFFSSVPAEILQGNSSALEVVVPSGAGFGPITVVNTITGLSSQSSFHFTPTFSDGGRLIPASFKSRELITLTGEPTGLTLGDVDADGNTDLLVSESSNVISIYRNLGAGGNLTASSFAPVVALPGAGNAGSLYLNDLDGDGKLDIIGEYTSASLTYFATFRNTSTPGNISFEAVKLWPGLVYSGFLSRVADIDGDGRADLMAQHGSGSVFADFWIALNISTPGKIEFGGSVSYFGSATVDAGAGLNVGDLDGDNKADLVIEYGFGGVFAIVKNRSSPGNVLFDPPVAFSEGVNGGVQMVDMNNDSKLDLAWKKGSSNDDVTILLNDNNDDVLDASDFQQKIVINSELSNYGGLAIGDLNGDGKPDVTVSDATNIGVFENVYEGGPLTASAFVPAYPQQGAGNSTYPTSVLSADLNGDDRPDLVVGITNVNPGRIYLYENINTHAPYISLNTVSPLSGAPGTIVTITGDYFSAIPADNLVRFGTLKAEVVSATRTEIKVRVPAGASIGTVSVTRDGLTSEYHLPFQTGFSNGTTFDDTRFAPPVSFTLAGADYDLEVGDLNGDQKPDIVAEGGAQTAYAFRNVHTGGSISALSLTPDDTTSANAANVKIMDFDGDGLTDLISISGVFQNASTATDIKFNAPMNVTSGGNFGFGDFNLDGKVDFVGVNGSNAEVTENRTRPGVFTSVTPYQSFSPSFNYVKPAANGGAAAGDFDNDGYMDFIVSNPTTDNVTVFRNNGSHRITTTQFTAEPNIAVGDNPGRLYSADIDRDGKIDVLMYYSVTTTSQFVTVLHNQSTAGSISFNRVDFPIGVNATTATLNDLDGDGKVEIIVASESGNRFVILKNNSAPGSIDATSFEAPFNTTVTAPRGITTGDINMDGRPEIVLTRAAGQLLIYENLFPIASISIDTQPQDVTACYGNPATISVVASGGVNMTYQWQRFDIEFGVFVNILEGVFTGTTTPTLSVSYADLFFNGQYRCVVSADNVGSVISSVVSASVLPSPDPPTLNSLSSVCPGTSAVMMASGAAEGDYRWYTQETGGSAIPGETGSTYTTPSLTAESTFWVSSSDGNCESFRIGMTVLVEDNGACNLPPVIAPASADISVGGTAVINLLSLISDPDDNIDLTSLKIIVPPASGAIATIDANHNLILDYSGLTFTGQDQLTIEACDQSGSCVQQIITINIEGGLTVFNGVSPNGDDKNDFWFIQNINVLSDAKEKSVKVFNRWGDLVWEGENYDNTNVVFTGKNLNGKDLPSGTYFYQINFFSGRAQLSGYLSLKR